MHVTFLILAFYWKFYVEIVLILIQSVGVSPFFVYSILILQQIKHYMTSPIY
jgi:hypothetical protein